LEDVPLLMDYMLRHLSRELDRPIRGITEEARTALQKHRWPGNVRELYNAVRYAIVQSSGEIVTLSCLPDHVRLAALEADAIAGQDSWTEIRRIVRHLLACGSNDVYRQVGQMCDRVVLETVMQETSGNQLQAAERLGISRVTLRAKLRASRGESGDAESANDES